LNKNGVTSTQIKKVYEGRPNITDAIKNDEIQMIINTPLGKKSKDDDSFIRMAAIGKKIPYVTTIAAAEASVAGIEAVQKNKTGVKSLQDYHTQLHVATKA